MMLLLLLITAIQVFSASTVQDTWETESERERESARVRERNRDRGREYQNMKIEFEKKKMLLNLSRTVWRSIFLTTMGRVRAWVCVRYSKDIRVCYIKK